MSFSSEQKNGIIEQQYKNACCRRALLCGILSSKATVSNGAVILNLETAAFAEFCARLVSEFYGRVPEIRAMGGRCKTVIFESKAARKYIEAIADGGASLFQEKCPSCRASFFRGFFLAAGRVSDPTVQYHLEFSPISNHSCFADMLSESGIEVKSALRKGKTVLYAKKSGILEDFFALIGINNAAFALMNAQIEGELRNNANRVFNCDTNNIDKSVRASHKQIIAITRLEEANLLSSLPEELEKTARLRLLHKDLSLAQLAAVSVPAISKPGLSHRLNKIIEIADRLLGENK